VAVALLTNRTAAVDSPELMAALLATPFLPGAAAGAPGAVPAGGRGARGVAAPAALRERARRAGLPMPDRLPVLGTVAGAPPAGAPGRAARLTVVASPLGLHALRSAHGGRPPEGRPSTGSSSWLSRGRCCGP
jgi:hypothetical protein